MSIIKPAEHEFPFDWADLNSYRNSNAFRREIYLVKQSQITDDLILLFYSLFGPFRENIVIYSKSWWDFCLDTWDFNREESNYELDGKSIETQRYLKLLEESNVEKGYSGYCTCNDWDRFLKTTVECIVNHKAPYSPLFCDIRNNYFFYFHETGSIGIYFKEENEAILKILATAEDEYDITE